MILVREGRMPMPSGAGRGQRGAGIGVDDDRRELRAVAVPILVVVTGVMMGCVAMTVVTARLSAVGRERRPPLRS